MRKLISFLLVLIVSATLFATGCTDAQISNLTSLGDKFVVTMWGQNGPVKTWTSTGKVLTEQNSDGWCFRDSATGRFVRVSGNVSVEEAP